MFAPNMPTLTTALRGMIYMEWEARGPKWDLHSGVYGGVAPNAVFGLVELLAKCKNSAGVCQIPGFYDDIEAPSEAEKQSWASLPFDEDEFLKSEVGSACLPGAVLRSEVERRTSSSRSCSTSGGIPFTCRCGLKRTSRLARRAARIDSRSTPRRGSGRCSVAVTTAIGGRSIPKNRRVKSSVMAS